MRDLHEYYVVPTDGIFGLHLEWYFLHRWNLHGNMLDVSTSTVRGDLWLHVDRYLLHDGYGQRYVYWPKHHAMLLADGMLLVDSRWHVLA